MNQRVLNDRKNKDEIARSNKAKRVFTDASKDDNPEEEEVMVQTEFEVTNRKNNNDFSNI